VGIPAVKLPSTSPANAACTMERLLAEYAAIFEHAHESASAPRGEPLASIEP
jgi:G:T/U-mismatch repair DNA glycosylase